MTRVHSLTNALSIWVYADHMPPHFHIRAPNSNALVDLRTLQIMRGTCDRKDFAAVLAWAGVPENRRLLEAEWDRLNARD